MIDPKLQQAIDNLRIQDVYLHQSMTECKQGFNPKYHPDLASLAVQKMQSVRQSTLVEEEDNGRLLQVLVAFGARWVDPAKDDQTEDGQTATVYARIEAEFIGEYRLLTELSQDCVNEFALKNASYHLWPYWREYLASQCERMRLPRLVLPAVQLSHHRHPQNDNE